MTTSAAAPPLDEADGTPAPEQSPRRRRKVLLLLILLIIAISLALVTAWYLSTRKPLTELPGLNRAKLPHYVSSIYGMTGPMAVAVSPSGDRIYVTESDGTRLVRVYDRAGAPVGSLRPPKSTGAAHAPVYVAINPVTHDVYVSDRLTASVYVYDEKGTYLRAFAPKGIPGGGWAPLGLAFSPNGSLYATDVSGSAHRVLVFGPDGVLLRALGAPGVLSFPNGIVVDPRGNVEVSDSNNGRLVVFDPAGKLVAMISRGVGDGDLGLPRGVALDDAGRLFVVDTSDHMVRVYRLSDAKTETPKYVGSFGGEGRLDGTFEYPNGVATDARAHIYVTDRENNRVQVWGF